MFNKRNLGGGCCPAQSKPRWFEFLFNNFTQMVFILQKNHSCNDRMPLFYDLSFIHIQNIVWIGWNL